MTSKVECVIITCDNCENVYEDGNGYSIFADKNSAYPSEYGWHVDKDKHYCPSCYELDENDNLILKKIEKKSAS